MVKALELAQNLTTARKTATGFKQYPAVTPTNLEFSYNVQDAAIDIWQDQIVGWKIGRLSPEAQLLHKTERLSGPIFAQRFWPEANAGNVVGIIDGGFAAVEAEFVFEVKTDSDPKKFEYSEVEAFNLLAAMHCGIEIAGSPIFDINSYGPTVVASDFGNNFGLILGNRLLEFSDIEQLSPANCRNFTTQTKVNGENVGTGGLFSIPGGPLAAIAWLAGHLAKRNRPLKRGHLISSGATTGIHDFVVGDSAKVHFGHNGSIKCEMPISAIKLIENWRGI